ncbi:hypothetical protein [Zooshikella ganghwensis]|uniref:Cytochrome oxidase assembly protein n=1 Tax=Zooshikella ganghwensis TaxID=202772 RepID=A0A4P9VI02_9GAMM|nr:hypothetical protein [Zooshikella ganghwensis]RDH42069.1 hypothetical protein B9G39_00655 [Zooshikella ganghwensis]
MSSSRKNKLLLIIILCTPIVVMALSSTMFKTGFLVPSTTTNRGILLQPELSIEKLNINNGSLWLNKQVDPRWSIVIIPTNKCMEQCEQALYLTRQVHIALGKEANRIQRILLNTQASPLQTELKNQHPRLNYLPSQPGHLDPLAKLIKHNFPEDNVGIFLVDPLGNIIMQYSAKQNGQDLLKDIKHLLKISLIG